MLVSLRGHFVFSVNLRDPCDSVVVFATEKRSAQEARSHSIEFKAGVRDQRPKGYHGYDELAVHQGFDSFAF